MILNLKSKTELSGFYIIFNRTTLNESNGNYGISHLIEHLISHNFNDDIVDSFQNHGINWNAYTSPTEIVFFMTGLKKYVSEYKNLFLDKMMYISITDKEFINEKSSLLEEYNSLFNLQGPSHVLNLYRKLLNTYSSIGYKDDIIKISLDECEEYYKKYYYAPSKIINVSKDDFSLDMKFNNYTNNSTISYNIKNRNIEKYQTLSNKSSIVYFSPIINDWWATVSFINYMISSGLGSPLYKNIRKKHGLSYYIKCNLNRLSDSCGVNILSTETNDNKVDILMDVLNDTISDESFLTEKKFNESKNSIINKMKIIDINRYSNVDSYIKPDKWSIERHIHNMTLDNVINVYHKYFNVNNFYKSVDKKEFLS